MEAGTQVIYIKHFARCPLIRDIAAVLRAQGADMSSQAMGILPLLPTTSYFIISKLINLCNLGFLLCNRG